MSCAQNGPRTSNTSCTRTVFAACCGIAVWSSHRSDSCRIAHRPRQGFDSGSYSGDLHSGVRADFQETMKLEEIKNKTIVAGILVARHLKNPEALHESPPTPRTYSLLASALQCTAHIMHHL